MSGTFKSGFTFLELVVVIMLLGIMTTIIIPNLRYLIPAYKREDFINDISVIIRLGWQNALMSQKTHRIWFDLNKRLIRLEYETKKPEQSKEFFELVSLTGATTEYRWPETIAIKQFFIEGKDVMSMQGIKTEQIWFYVVPEGLVQEVIMNFTDSNQLDSANKPLNFNITVNPFTAQIESHEGFAKP